MNKTAVFLAFSVLAGTSFSQEDDYFSFFEEPMSPKIEVNVKSLNYERNENESLSQGKFSFDKFKIISEKTNLTLNNDSNFYDANIYRRGQMIGFKGPAASFAYKLRDEDFKYVDSFSWLVMDEVYYFMDRSEITLKGKAFAMREPQTMLLTNNFKLDCRRHENYLLNDGDGFLAGCLNYGEAKPLEGQGIGTEFKFFDEDGKKIIDLKGYYKSASFDQNKMSTDITSLTSNFSDEVLLNATEVKFECEKPEDVIKVSPETFVVPCMNNLNIQGDFLSTEFLEDNDKMNVMRPAIIHAEKVLTVDHEGINYKGKESSFELSNSILKCNIPAGEDILEIETFLKGCLNDSEIISKEKEVLYSFKSWEAEGDPLDVLVKGDIRKFSAQSENLLMDSKELTVEVDKNLLIDFKQVGIECQKEAGLDKFNAKELLEFCKKDLALNVDSFSIRDYLDQTKPVLMKTNPESALNRGGRLTARLPELKLVDREDITIMSDVDISCDTTEEIDIFNPNQIIKGCVKDGKIKIDKLFTEDSTLSASKLLDPETNIDNVRIEKKKPKIYDIDLETRNGQVNGKIHLRVWGMKSHVSFSGPITWDMDKEVLTIQIKKSRLPLGIKSKKVFMYFIKKMLVAEMISYDEDQTIKISL